jgi:methylenetetrahydrofolate reductase (NADPH)
VPGGSPSPLISVAETNRRPLASALSHPRFELVPIKGVEEHSTFLPQGSTVPITSSPSSGNENTLQVAEVLFSRGFRVVPHIAARLVIDRAHLRRIVDRFTDLGVREIFVIGGDAKTQAGKYAGALDLLREMADLGHSVKEIGVAAHPEGHPFIEPGALLESLREKQTYATYFVTQIAFDPIVIGKWLGEARQEGIELPAYIGFAGVVDTVKLLRISMRIGVGDSIRFLRKRTALVAGLLRHSGNEPTAFVEGLTSYFGDPSYHLRGLHINTFNQVQSTEVWRAGLLTKLAAGRNNFPRGA